MAIYLPEDGWLKTRSWHISMSARNVLQMISKLACADATAGFELLTLQIIVRKASNTVTLLNFRKKIQCYQIIYPLRSSLVLHAADDKNPCL